MNFSKRRGKSFFSTRFLLAGLLLGNIPLFKASGQKFTMDNYTDTTLYHKGLISLYKKYDRVRISGYMQPQFQFAGSKGAAGYAGGDFPTGVNNRFSMRRGRFRMDYAHDNSEGLPSLLFVFQFDGTERGFFARDFFGRVYENKWHLFNFTAGIFSRPFGYEVNLGSADRESPERGRMSQILMKTERDTGAMITFSPQRKGHPLHFLKVDLGIFNGQGISNAVNDFDSHKDVIGRISASKLKISPDLELSAGTSVLYGGMQQFTREIYTMGDDEFEESDAASNVGKIAPRHYYGADIQLTIPNREGATELRAEYITGTQTGTAGSTESPPVIPMLNGVPAPLYIRPFNGAYFYFLQDLGSPRHQLGLKYDWYDPNTDISGQAIDNRFTGADIAFHTVGFGYNYYISDNLRLLLWYDVVRNEKTSAGIYQRDIPDNVFTSRLQFRF